MKIAVVPWNNEKFFENKMFDINSSANVNNLMQPFAEMKHTFESNGDTINTIDMYSNPEQADYILFLDWSPEYFIKLIDRGLNDRLVYCNGEPDTVRPENSAEGYNNLILKIFPYVMTWNRRLVDNKRIFYRTIPYTFVNKFDDTPLNEKKLITSISANKHSNQKNELYTTREQLISYFENEIPDEFDFYGTNWKSINHPAYKGSPDDKFTIYHKYKFAIAFENTKNVTGYITEKIFDCICSGIVPIYLGADDILDYVPNECFVDYRNFHSPKELLSFISNMSETEYMGYIESQKEFLQSRKDIQHKFSGDEYADNIYCLTKNSKMNGFHADKMVLLKQRYACRHNMFKEDIKSLLRH